MVEQVGVERQQELLEVEEQFAEEQLGLALLAEPSKSDNCYILLILRTVLVPAPGHPLPPFLCVSLAPSSVALSRSSLSVSDCFLVAPLNFFP